MRRLVIGAIVAALTSLLVISTNAQQQRPLKPIDDDGMSPMGHKAAVQARARAKAFLNSLSLAAAGEEPPDEDECDDNGCDTGGGEDEENGPAGTQSELAIAIDATGLHLVVGFNDFRGFSLDPTVTPASISGFAYSDDGGLTWIDGGQLPSTANGQLSNGTKLPQVFGDPDVKYVPGGAGCQFIYSSIMVKGRVTAPNFVGTAQTMSLHRSVDCGHTWSGPFEVTAATNPHGLLSGVNARDAADKEFLDVDPDTGRVILSWSNFTSTTFIPGSVEIRTTFSDDVMTGTPPTWSAGVVLNPGSPTFDTGSMPRFARGGSNNVYAAWATISLSTGLSNTRVATSTNNGATWNAPVSLNASDFFPIDYILGNDRVHSFPGLAVGPEGNVYVVYSNNNGHDGADVVFHRSTDGGATFSAAMPLNSRPGADRAQWFPYAATDQNGRLYVTYYDQGVAPSGDLTDVRFGYSDDGGLTWSKPSTLMSTGCNGIASDPLDCRSFHAGYGNDTGQPNLGDYNGATTFNGALYAVWAATPRLVSFADGQPTSSFTVPDFYVNKVDAARAALVLGSATFTESGGNGSIDPGDQVALTLPLSNFVTNAIAGPVTYTGVTGTLSTSTAGVSILGGTRTYPNIAPGATEANAATYLVQVDQTFVPGTRIELTLAVSTGQGSTTLLWTQLTGTPIATTIFQQDFDGVPPGSLPAGWATIHAGGNNIVPWTTSSTFCGATSNALFHANANDGLGNNPVRFERVASPNILVPANAEYVTLDFDVCYDTEDDPNFNVLAYDGALLRITDFTTGRSARANLVEAFAEELTTGALFHYPKHNPRSSNAAYFQDMSMWAGDSGGFRHVHMRLPGMAGATIQLRPDYTQDSFGTCADVRPGHTCGVIIDNIVMKSVVSSSTVTTSTALASSQNPSDFGEPVTLAATVLGGTPVTTGAVTFKEGATVLSGPTAVDASGRASFVTSSLATGTHTITAEYSDGAGFAPSSGSLAQVVDPLPTFTINDVSVAEGNVGVTNAVFTVTLSAATHAAVAHVDFATADGSATVTGNDYAAAGGTLAFGPGETSHTIAVSVIGDNVFEPDEDFVVGLSNATHSTVADAQGVGRILNDDSVPTITIGDASVAEGNAGTTAAVFTVSLSNPSSRAITVNFATADGSATAGSDYTAGAGSLTFAPLDTCKTITVPVIGDVVFEPDEAFTVSLSDAVNAVVADAQGTGTIRNDDGVPSISINDVSVRERNHGTTPAVFSVTLSNPSSSAVRVRFATADGTASAGSDYVAAAVTLRFAPLETSKTIAVLVKGDFIIEPNETYAVELSDASGATIGDGHGVGTIRNDDTVHTTLQALIEQVEGCTAAKKDCRRLQEELCDAEHEIAAHRPARAIHELKEFILAVQLLSRSNGGHPPRIRPDIADIWIAEARSIISALTS